MEPGRITSPTNATVKDAVRLRRKRHRRERSLFITEGEDLLDVAIASGRMPRQVFVLDGAEGSLSGFGAVTGSAVTEVFVVSVAVMDRLSAMGGNARVVSIFGFVDGPLPVLEGEGEEGVHVLLAGVRDPGNAGAIIRSAAALGASGVIVSEAGADIYSPRAVQATMGSIFRVPMSVIPGEGTGVESWARDAGLVIAGADPHEGEPPWECELTGGLLLVLGSEREGIAGSIAGSLDIRIRIPQRSEVESLNVAMAGTVILYEAMRQRSI